MINFAAKHIKSKIWGVFYFCLWIFLWSVVFLFVYTFFRDSHKNQQSCYWLYTCHDIEQVCHNIELSINKMNNKMYMSHPHKLFYQCWIVIYREFLCLIICPKIKWQSGLLFDNDFWVVKVKYVENLIFVDNFEWTQIAQFESISV